MKNYFLLFILVLTFGCSQKETDIRIDEFEKVLGSKQAGALNMLVSDFEKNLKEIYPNSSIQNAYEKYLKEISTATKKDGNKFSFQSDETNATFHESGLWDEIYEIDDDRVLSTKAAGKVIKALFTLEHSDSLVNKFRRNRQDAGFLSNEMFMRQTLNSKPNFDNYFHKRVVVLNYSY